MCVYVVNTCVRICGFAELCVCWFVCTWLTVYWTVNVCEWESFLFRTVQSREPPVLLFMSALIHITEEPSPLLSSPPPLFFVSLSSSSPFPLHFLSLSLMSDDFLVISFSLTVFPSGHFLVLPPPSTLVDVLRVLSLPPCIRDSPPHHPNGSMRRQKQEKEGTGDANGPKWLRGRLDGEVPALSSCRHWWPPCPFI